MRSLLVIVVVLGISGCELLSGPSVTDRLVGQYAVVHIRGTPVPGWLKDCSSWVNPCDSVYVSGSDLEFMSGGQCRLQAVFDADTTRYGGSRCLWRATGDGAEMNLAGRGWTTVGTGDLEAGYVTVVFQAGCPDLDFDPCGQDWWVFRRKP